MTFFKTIDEFRKYVIIDANMSFDLMEPFIKDAQDLFMKDLLGDFYTVILADYRDHTTDDGANGTGVPTPMDPDNWTLLPYIQKPLAYYASFLALPQLGASLGSSGVQEQYTVNSRPAARYKIRDLQLQYINQGDRFADALLEFLEEEATALKYSEWFEDADANTSVQGVIVYSTKIASRHIDINESRRVFLRLKKRILEIEKNDIKRMMCSDQYAAIVAEIKAGTLSSANEALIALLEPYIAKKALYLTIPSIRISVTDEGITIHSSNDSVVQKTAAAREEVKDLLCSLKDGEYGYDADWDKINQFIIENIADYPLIEASPCWTSKNTTDPKYQVDNDRCNKHFSV
ncbi:MAG TPA: DUF6712 family protein [Chryseolinea sp.]|nr:DUF6712 family protein [Chryseolinea sp.]